MKRKTLLVLFCLSLVISATATGCGLKISLGRKPAASENQAPSEAQVATDFTQKETPVMDDSNNTQSNDTQSNDTQSNDTQSNDTQSNDTQSNDTQSQPSAGGAYVDYANRTFSINGKTYTLGVNTLQDLIDGGVPFDSADLANASNNLDAHTESTAFGIPLGDYYTAQVSVMNTGDVGHTVSECPISSIYMPVHEEPQSVLAFAFPLDLTEDVLTANAGEPTDRRVYEDGTDYKSVTVEYMQDSQEYFGDSGYCFEFVNGSLSYVTVNWRP